MKKFVLFLLPCITFITPVFCALHEHGAQAVVNVHKLCRPYVTVDQSILTIQVPVHEARYILVRVIDPKKQKSEWPLIIRIDQANSCYRMNLSAYEGCRITILFGGIATTVLGRSR